mgnify:CR=1 FL=1
MYLYGIIKTITTMGHIELFEKERALGYNCFVDTWIPNYYFFLEKLPQLLQNKVSNKHLLAVGCGTGNEIDQFCNDQSWHVTGIDPSPEMIQQAIERFGKRPNVHLIHGAIEHFEPLSPFGAATLLLVLHFMKDDGSKLQLLSAISKKLELNAPLILLDITGKDESFKDNLNLLSLLLPESLPEAEVAQRLQRIERALYPVSEERLVQLLHEAGFGQPCRFFQTTIYMGWIAYRR